MVQELSIVTATPVVSLTKQKKFTENYVEVRADDLVARLSIHYAADVEAGGVPSVQEQLLVAVLAGVPRDWLHEYGPRREKVDIRWEGVSAKLRHGSATSGHDTMHLMTAREDRLVRVNIGMFSEARKPVSEVVLSKGQVTTLLAALLSIYPDLEED